MRYYLDTEFNGPGGYLMSLALVREDGRSIYWVESQGPEVLKPWVEENVWPVMGAYPYDTQMLLSTFIPAGMAVAGLMMGDPDPIIIADWPIDFMYLSAHLVIEPDRMVPIGRLQMNLERVDAWPNSVPNAIRHNAWWDAFCLLSMLQPDCQAARTVYQPVPHPTGKDWEQVRADYPVDKVMALRDPGEKTH